MIWLGLITIVKFATYIVWLGGIIPSWVFMFLVNPLTAFFLYKLVKKQQRNPLYPYALALLDALVPVVGFIGLLLFYLCGFVFKYINYSENDEEYMLPLGASSYQSFELEKKINLQNQFENNDKEKEDILSLMEVEPLEQALLGNGKIQMKISAIDQLSRIGSRKSIEILKKSLKLDEYEVRYFANGALEEIEKRRLEEIKLISEGVGENPDDASLYKDRGAAYLEMYRLGLLDPSIQNVFLEKALLDFMTSLSLNPSQSYLYTRIIEINLLLKKYDELLHLADYALKTGLSPEDKAKIYFYKAEASYANGDYQLASDFCELAGQHKTEFRLINSCLDWWTHAS